MISLTPMPGKLILRHLTDEELADNIAEDSIIIIPDTVKDRQKVGQGIVVSVGEGVWEPALLPGVRVMYDRFRTVPFEFEDETFYSVWEEDIKALI